MVADTRSAGTVEVLGLGGRRADHVWHWRQFQRFVIGRMPPALADALGGVGGTGP